MRVVERYLKFADLKVQYGLHRATVQALVDSGELVAINLARNRFGRNRRLVFQRADVEAFLASRQVRPQAVPRGRTNESVAHRHVSAPAVKKAAVKSGLGKPSNESFLARYAEGRKANGTAKTSKGVS